MAADPLFLPLPEPTLPDGVDPRFHLWNVLTNANTQRTILGMFRDTFQSIVIDTADPNKHFFFWQQQVPPTHPEPPSTETHLPAHMTYEALMEQAHPPDIRNYNDPVAFKDSMITDLNWMIKNSHVVPPALRAWYMLYFMYISQPLQHMIIRATPGNIAEHFFNGIHPTMPGGIATFEDRVGWYLHGKHTKDKNTLEPAAPPPISPTKELMVYRNICDYLQ